MKQGKHNLEYPAQPDNLAVQQAMRMLELSASTLMMVAGKLCRQRVGRKVRAEAKRQLSGVLASVEIVRQAIKE